MNKRNFVNMAFAVVGGFPMFAQQATALTDDRRSVADDGVTFTWHHQAGRLRGTLSAPSAGWIAVGFNEARSLRNTWFVIASVASKPMRVEEHIALVPDHRNIEDLGITPSIDHVSGFYREGRSQLEFSLPHALPKRPALRLEPGTKIHMMLAWSHEPDFNHHSAWRRHYDLVL